MTSPAPTPSRPEEAVLYRNLRWQMLLFQSVFVLAFGGVGFGMLVYLIFSRRKERNRRASAVASWRPQ